MNLMSEIFLIIARLAKIGPTTTAKASTLAESEESEDVKPAPVVTKQSKVEAKKPMKSMKKSPVIALSEDEDDDENEEDILSLSPPLKATRPRADSDDEDDDIFSFSTPTKDTKRLVTKKAPFRKCACSFLLTTELC